MLHHRHCLISLMQKMRKVRNDMEVIKEPNYKAILIHNMASAFLAGIMIGLGGLANLSCEDNRYMGAFLFSFGLISVIMLKAKLFTGKVGFARDSSDIINLVFMCFMNFLGAFVIGVLSGDKSPMATYIIERKLANGTWHWLSYSVICGILIHLAVEMYKRKNSLLTIILPVMIFVLTGSEHCVANAYYIACSRYCGTKSMVFILICIIGNSIGALLARNLIKSYGGKY